MDGRVSGALLDLALEPRVDELEAVALLHLLDELVDGDISLDREQKALNDVLVAVDVEKCAQNNRCARGVDLEKTSFRCEYLLFSETNLLDVDLNVLLQVVAVQIEDKVVDKVEAVADDDQRKLISELGFLEEVLDSLGVVNARLAANALDLLHLTSLARSLHKKKSEYSNSSKPVLSYLDVLEVHIGLLRKVDNRAEVVVETLKALERLKHVDQRLGGELLGILDGDLDDDLDSGVKIYFISV